MKRTSLACLMAVSLASMVPARAAAAPIISAPFVTVGVGDTFAIDISVADAVDLIAWQFDLAFDPTIVAVTSVAEGPFLSDFGTTLSPPTTFSPGVVAGGSIFGLSDFFNDLPPNPAGSGVLATIAFTALAPGISPLTFSNVFLNFNDSGLDVVNGQITVTGAAPPTPQPEPVPEPASLALLSTGAGLLWLRQRSRNRR